jgi:hypothetical protein
MRRQASVLRGPDAPDPSLRYRGILGLLRENYPGLADWIGDTAGKVWNDPGLRLLPGPMAIEMEGVEAAEAAQELIQTGWQGGIFNPRGKTVARARAASAKGGRMAGITRRLRAAAEFDDEMYRGPEIDPEIAHEASAAIDEKFPHLRDAFAKTEADIRRQEAASRGGRASASVRAPRDIAPMRGSQFKEGNLLWAINPRTGRARFSPLIPSDATPEAYRGFETHADWF